MSTPLRNCIFLLLSLLCMIHQNNGREIAKGSEQNIETSYDDDHLCLNHHHHGCHKEMMMSHDFYQHTHAHESSSSSSVSNMDDHIDVTWNIFFQVDDLKVGNKLSLYLSNKNSSISPHIIPKQEAELIPFSSNELPKILEFFSFSQDSPQAKAILHTLIHCELPPLKGETKFCATSLESMLDGLGLIFGLGNNFKVLTTTQMKNIIPQLQNYTILEDPKEIHANKMASCHPLSYPYAVYYCHAQGGDNRLFKITLEGEKDGARVEAMAICHMDTSQWQRDHVSFRVLRLEPGSSPVCHVFPQDNLICVSSSSSDD